MRGLGQTASNVYHANTLFCESMAIFCIEYISSFLLKAFLYFCWSTFMYKLALRSKDYESRNEQDGLMQRLSEDCIWISCHPFVNQVQCQRLVKQISTELEKKMR